MFDKKLEVISSNLFPQFKSLKQLMSDTNHIFHWDRLAYSDSQILYEKAVDCYGRKQYEKAAELFVQAAVKVKKSPDDYWKMMYCACESTLWSGNPTALVDYTYELYEQYHGFPKWLDKELGLCGIAHCLLADSCRDKEEKEELINRAGVFLMQYFEKTGYFKDYVNELPYYIFFGYACYHEKGQLCLLSYATEMRTGLPAVYREKVVDAWKQLGIL